LLESGRLNFCIENEKTLKARNVDSKFIKLRFSLDNNKFCRVVSKSFGLNLTNFVAVSKKNEGLICELFILQVFFFKYGDSHHKNPKERWKLVL